MTVLAIDTGGTKIAGAAVDGTGRILEKVRYPNQGRSGEFILSVYCRIIEELGGSWDYDAIGIGAGGRIEAGTGKVLYAVDIYQGYIGLEIGNRLREKFQKPVFVTNDCRSALLGESWVGAARSYKKVAALILGTGVGGGFVYEDRLLDGSKGGFGEFGHMILHPGGYKCMCGQNGCVEQYLSGTALWKQYNRLAGKEELQNGYGFFQLLEGNDRNAQRVLQSFEEDLANTLINLANLLDPDAILLGGGLIDTREYWWERMEACFRQWGNLHIRRLPLLAAEMGNDAALVGAARFAMDGLMGMP